jgi:transcription initiation factor TFIIB
MEPIDPKLFVPRFCSDLDVDPRVQRRAVSILEAGADEGLHSGKSPTGLAGAAIYLASQDCGESITQSAVADVAQVTEVTIRNRYHEHQTVSAVPE